MVQLDLSILQFDIKTVIEENIYMKQPPLFNDQSGKVCKLNKSLCGLKQAARDWYHELSGTLIDYGFKVSESDQCLFVYCLNNCYQIIGIHVDDGLVCTNDIIKTNQLFHYLNKKYIVKSSDKVSSFLCLEIKFEKGELMISQEN